MYMYHIENVEHMRNNVAVELEMTSKHSAHILFINYRLDISLLLNMEGMNSYNRFMYY